MARLLDPTSLLKDRLLPLREGTLSPKASLALLPIFALMKAPASSSSSIYKIFFLVATHQQRWAHFSVAFLAIHQQIMISRLLKSPPLFANFARVLNHSHAQCVRIIMMILPIGNNSTSTRAPSILPLPLTHSPPPSLPPAVSSRG